MAQGANGKKRRHLNRREFLQAGSGALGAMSLAPRKIVGPLHWQRREAGVALLENQTEVWFVPATALGASTHLDVNESAGTLTLSLTKGLVLESTPLALHLRIAPGSGLITLDTSYMSRPVEADLSMWLSGFASLEGAAKAAIKISIPEVGQITLHRGRVSLDRRLHWTWTGHGVARVELDGGAEITADTAVLEPEATVAPQEEFPAAIAPSAALLLNAGRLRQHSGNGFQIPDTTLRFQEGEARIALYLSTAPETPKTVLQLQSTGNEPASVQASAGAAGIQPGMFFDDFRVTVVRSGSGEYRRLAVRLRAPRWYRSELLALKLSAASYAAVVEAIDGNPAIRDTGLTIERLRVPLPGADWVELRPQVPVLDYRAAFSDGKRGMPGIAVDRFRVRACRARDLVDIEFSFANARLRRRDGSFQLEKADPARPALFRVHLRPQATGEQTHFVQESDGYEDESAKKNSHESFNPNDKKWKSKEFEKLFEDCQQPDDFPRDQCRRAKIAEMVDQKPKLKKINEFEARPKDCLRPFVYSSETSRLVFEWPDAGMRSLVWSLADLLDWHHLRMIVNPRSAPRESSWFYQAQLAQKELAPVASDETSIDAPFRFQLSPLVDEACIAPGAPRGPQVSSTPWLTTPTPQREGIVELWNTRLHGSHVRAIWANGFLPSAFADRFGHTGASAGHPTHARETESGCAKDGRLLSLDARDRHEIVALSSVFGLQSLEGAAGVIAGPDPSAPALFSPSPISSEIVALSTVGASLRLRGTWEPPIPASGPKWGALTVEDWISRHSWGREVLARVVYKGFLFPLGVRVALVKVTERRLTRDPLDGKIKAPLWQRLFIVLPKKPKHYPAPRQPCEGRDWDAVKIDFITQQTPDLIDPTVIGQTGFEQKPCDGELNYTRDLSCWSLDLFWPQVEKGRDVIFKYRVTDRGTKVTVRSGPLLFVSNFLAYQKDVVARIHQYYDALPDQRRTVTVAGQQVGYAPILREASARPQTAFETDRIILGAHVVDLPPDKKAVDKLLTELQSANHPLFYPRTARADVRIPAIAQIQGADAPPTSITYDRTYCESAFSTEKNQAQVFARIVGDGVGLDAGRNSSTTGGVSSPTTRIAAISRSLGLVGGTTNTASREGAGSKSAEATGAEPQDSIAQLQSGRFDPALMFSTSAGEAKLLGSIRISDVIAVAASQLGSVPKFIDEIVFDASETLKDLFCDPATGLAATLARLSSGVAALPASAAKSRLTPRLAALVDRHNSICANWDTGDPARLASELTGFVAEAQHFVEDVRAIANNPAELVPEEVQKALEGVMAVLAPFLPPFDPLDVLRNEVKRMLDAVAAEALDAARAEVLAQLEPLKDYFRPALLDAWHALVRLRERLSKEGAAVEAAVMARFSDVSQVISGQVDQLALLAEAALSNACKDALKLLKEAEAHIPHDFESSLRKILQQADTAVRGLATIARNEQAPAEVRRLATSLHSSIRPVWDDVAAVLNRILINSVKVPNLEEICDLDWQNPASEIQAKVQAALAAAHDFLHLALAPGQLVTLINPLIDAVKGAKDRLGEAAGAPSSIARASAVVIAASAAPTGDFPSIKAQLEALEGEVAELVKQAIRVFTRSPTGDLGTAIQTRIEAIKEIVKKAQAANLGERLTALLTEHQTRFVTLADDLKNSTENLPLLEQLARAELTIWQAIVDAAVPGSLPGFEKVKQWHTAWQNAMDSLQQPALAAITKIDNALPNRDQLGPNGAYGKFLAKPVRDDFEQLRDALTDAKNALDTTHMSGRALRSLAQVATLGERIATTVTEHLLRGDITAVISLDPLVGELEDIVRSIVPARRVFKYDWGTALKPFPPGAPIFIPLGGVDPDLEIHSRLEVALTSGGPKASSELSGIVRNFKIALFPGFPLLTIVFSEVSFRSRDLGSPTYDVKIDDVQLGAAFEFVAGLAKELLGGSDDGPYLRLVPSPPAIEAGFSFGADIAQFGAFTVQNLRLSLAFRLPLDNRSATFVFAFASRNKPFLMSSGIYGGGGFLALTATPTKLVAVEGAMEFGAVTAIKFGPLHASGRVVAGFYFRFEESSSALSGYVLAAGSGKIGWFGISVLLRVEVKSNGSSVTGSARFEVSFEISSVVKVTFEFTAAYQFKGGTGAGSLRSLRAPLTYTDEPGAGAAAMLRRCPETDGVAEPDDPCKDPKASRKRVRSKWKNARRRYGRFERA